LRAILDRAACEVPALEIFAAFALLYPRRFRAS
jgi:hypothetical protein